MPKTDDHLLDPESFYSISQFRSALWRYLRKLARHLSAHPDDKMSLSQLQNAVKDLETLEKFWGFPGRQFIQSIKERVVAREYKALLSDIALCLRAFSAALYRKDNAFSLFSTKKQIPQDKSGIMNYFEVLFVDHIYEKDQEQLRETLKGYGQSQKDFFYGTVFATSYEEALTAIIFNPLIQTVVIRYQIVQKKKQWKEPLLSIFSGFRSIGCHGSPRQTHPHSGISRKNKKTTARTLAIFCDR